MRSIFISLILLSGCGGSGSDGPSLAVRLSPNVVIGDSIIAMMGDMGALNLGKAADTTSMILARFGQIPPNAGTVLIEGGINDLVLQRDNEIVPDYAAMLDALRDVQVVVVGILPVEEAKLHPEWQPLISTAKVNEFNALIYAECARRPKCAYVGINPFETIDGIHPTAAGKDALTARLASLLS